MKPPEQKVSFGCAKKPKVCKEEITSHEVKNTERCIIRLATSYIHIIDCTKYGYMYDKLNLYL